MQRMLCVVERVDLNSSDVVVGGLTVCMNVHVEGFRGKYRGRYIDNTKKAEEGLEFG